MHSGIGRRRKRGIVGVKTFTEGAQLGGAGNLDVRIGSPCHGVVVIVPAGARRGLTDVDVKGHALQAMTGDGAVAFDAGFDHTGIELHGIAWIDAAGFGIANLKIVHLVPGIGEVNHQVSARIHVNMVGYEGHAIDFYVNGVGVTFGGGARRLGFLRGGIDYGERDNRSQRDANEQPRGPLGIAGLRRLILWLGGRNTKHLILQILLLVNGAAHGKHV